MTFDFIFDNKLRDILIRDFNEMKACFGVKAYKAVLVLSGSILEAMLFDFFNQYPSKTSKGKNTLKDLIDEALAANLFENDTKELASVIRDYRNLIHPSKEQRGSKNCDEQHASIAKNLVDIIISKIEIFLKAQYPYTAKSVINKIKNDCNTIHVFEAPLNNLSDKEKETLLAELIEISLDKSRHIMHYGSNWGCPSFDGLEVFSYIKIIKNTINTNVISKYLTDLIHHIEIDDAYKAFNLYRLFNDKLDLCSAENITKILRYFLGDFEDHLYDCKYLEYCVEDSLFTPFRVFIDDAASPIQQKIFNFLSKTINYYTSQRVDYLTARAIFNQISKDDVNTYTILTTQFGIDASLPFFHNYNEWTRGTLAGVLPNINDDGDDNLPF